MMHFSVAQLGQGPVLRGYLKHQTLQGQTLAAIPVFHIGSGDHCTASFQIISNNGSVLEQMNG